MGAPGSQVDCPAPLLPLRLLIVDDGDRMAAQVLAAMRRSGHEIEAARVETEGDFRARLESRWDVIVSDQALARFEATRALWVLEQTGQDPAFIVVSDEVEPGSVVTLMKAGAHDVLTSEEIDHLPSVVERELVAAAARRRQREAERRRSAEEERYRMLIEAIPALTYVGWADPMRSPAYVSPQIRNMLGFTPTEWLADREAWARQLHADDRDRVLAAFRQTCETGVPFRCEYRIHDRSGNVRWWHDESEPFTGGGRAPLVRGFVLDVTERKQAEDTIRFMTYHDVLTSLPNRALLQERLDAAIAESRRDSSPVGLLLLSLDGFREVINTLGQRNGDRIVQQLAQRLAEVLGEPERVARLRGDEFAVLLPGADEALARQVASQVEKALRRPFLVQRLPIEVGGSIGIAVRDHDVLDAETMLRRADLAVQVAKREGGGCVTYSAGCDPYDPARLALLGELRRAIESNQLVLHYQPKIDLHEHALLGAEALVRWRHPRHGMIYPDQFVPLAEKGGLIKALTSWVLARAVQECRTWEGQPRPVSVAVNLSAKNLHDPTLVDQVGDLLQSSGMGPERLSLELTETTVMSDPARAVGILRQIRDWGVDLAIDDFGTGYSSLAYLHTLPVSELKIDKSFVMGLGSDNDRNAAIVGSTSSLGHSLKLTVIAEGVEDAPTLDRLSSLGCDGAQGYHIARPMDAAAFGRWMRESSWH
jgi:diguanylate cyclase (GGDEF)-like protein/PAS domain S-box-containing protein